VIKARAVPEKIGEFALVAEIGKGTMGTVYRVKNSKGDLFVLKLPHPEVFADTGFRSRFLRDADIVGTFNHPGVVKMYEYRMKQGAQPYICFEHVQAQSLRAFMKKNPSLPLKVTAKIVTDLALALGYAHSKGIIHRYIKPENIMITDSHEVKLTDLGIPGAMDLKTPEAAAAVAASASSYLSPEQIEKKEADVRSDLYSLGVIFYELLTAQLPSREDGAGEPLPASSHNALISPEMEAIVMKLIRKNPRERYEAAAALIKDLKAFL
jgi:serine/threonine protein kinase